MLLRASGCILLSSWKWGRKRARLPPADMVLRVLLLITSAHAPLAGLFWKRVSQHFPPYNSTSMLFPVSLTSPNFCLTIARNSQKQEDSATLVFLITILLSPWSSWNNTNSELLAEARSQDKTRPSLHGPAEWGSPISLSCQHSWAYYLTLLVYFSLWLTFPKFFPAGCVLYPAAA